MRCVKRTKPVPKKGKHKIKRSEEAIEIFPSDKLKLALLYLVVSVLFIPAIDDSPIDESLLAIVDDLEFAKTYPCGRFSCSVMIEHLRNLELKKKLYSANPQCTFHCFILPLLYIRSILQPMAEERATLYIQSFAPYDVTTNITDPTTKLWSEILEKGGRILFDDIFRIDVESRPTVIPMTKLSAKIDDG